MSQNGCCCCSTLKSTNNKDTIVITIETCDKKLLDQTSDSTSTSKCPSSASCKASCAAIKKCPSAVSCKASCANQDGQRNDDAENKRVFTLPMIPPRHHGPGCAMEISIIEKHDQTCQFKKKDNSNRYDVDDRVGSYECIGRMVFRTCAGGPADGGGFPPGAQPPCGNPPPCGPSPPCTPGYQSRGAQMPQIASDSKCVPRCSGRCANRGNQAVFRLLAQSILDRSMKWDQDLPKNALLAEPQTFDSTHFQKDQCERYQCERYHCERSDPTSASDVDREKLSHIEQAITLRQEIEMLVTSLRSFATKPVDVGNQVPSHITTSVGISNPMLSNCRSFGNFKCKPNIQSSQETIISLGSMSNETKCEEFCKTQSITSSLDRFKAFFKRNKGKHHNIKSGNGNKCRVENYNNGCITDKKQVGISALKRKENKSTNAGRSSNRILLTD